MVADTQQSSAHAAHFTSAVYNINGAEKLGHWGAGIVSHLPDDRGP